MLITRGFSWLEPQIVVLNVAGSSPVFHPPPYKLSTYEGFLFVGSGYLETEIMLNMDQCKNLRDFHFMHIT